MTYWEAKINLSIRNSIKFKLMNFYINVSYDFYFKKLFSYLLIFPIAIPPYAVAYCYADITDKGGVIFNILEFLNILYQNV